MNGMCHYSVVRRLAECYVLVTALLVLNLRHRQIPTEFRMWETCLFQSNNTDNIKVKKNKLILIFKLSWKVLMSDVSYRTILATSSTENISCLVWQAILRRHFHFYRTFTLVGSVKSWLLLPLFLLPFLLVAWVVSQASTSLTWVVISKTGRD